MGLHQRLRFQKTAVGGYFAVITDANIVVLNAEALAFAGIRNAGIGVLIANLSGKARRAAATDAERARVQVEMGCLYQTRGLHPSQSPSVL